MAQSAITYILNDETLRKLSNHADKDAVNATYWYHVDRIGDALTKTERNILKTLTHYMVKFAGVAYTSRATLAKAVGCSVKSVQRAYAKFSKLGIIEIIAAKRQSDMRQTANILRLIPAPVTVADETETPVDPQAVPQATGENVPALNRSLAPKVIKDLKTFESASARECEFKDSDENSSQADQTPTTATAQQTLDAFNVPAEIQRALMPLSLPVAKLLTLVNPQDTRNIVNHVQSALIGDFPKVAANFDMQSYTDVIASAALRTAWVAKRKPVRNVVGYFLKTLVTELRKAFMAMTVECLAEITVEELGDVAYEGAGCRYVAQHVEDMAKVWVGAGMAQETAQAVLDVLADGSVPFGSLEGA
ncbi:helix-turn-helix domain-containing protein [Exiguobacterium sp. CinTr1]|uniref:helix-turn-helix domain-containing protein n=1 Tax=Exiguobacterium sp. CinTr1 TaxID=2995315 RepID=UPI0022E90D15|nr:helix-turn-helix domain-containing protein [Exiguobacterium sp. CinTr1]